MRRIVTAYKSKSTVEFLIDDDKQIAWVGKFDSNKYNRFFVIIDKNVNKIWGGLLKQRLKRHKKELFFFEVEAVEDSKSLSFYPKLVAFLELRKCNLEDLVIAIGGGVVIDLVSFTCSTYMRGLPFFIIATTLVGMVDASSAGKTCLSTKNNKNILGTFYYPLQVYNNIHFLETYSKYYHRQGLSEIFKYGLLGSEELLSNMDNLKKMIELGIKTRVAIRKKHPQASNLGHTFGQAIEKLTNYKILHGDAISVGTVIALYFGLDRGITTKEVIERIINMMRKQGLNLYLEKTLDIDKWVDAMMSDKKSSSKYLNLVLLRDIAKPYKKRNSFFYQTSPDVVRRFLKKFVKNYPYTKTNCAKFIRRNDLIYK